MLLINGNINTLVNNSNDSLPLNNNDINLIEVLNFLKMSAVKFSLQLHNNNNFSRKDILNIQSKIFDLILSPIILLFKGTLLDTIKDPLLILITIMIIFEISSIFKHCSKSIR